LAAGWRRRRNEPSLRALEARAQKVEQARSAAQAMDERLKHEIDDLIARHHAGQDEARAAWEHRRASKTSESAPLRFLPDEHYPVLLADPPHEPAELPVLWWLAGPDRLPAGHA
jgi:hypothetical protein